MGIGLLNPGCNCCSCEGWDGVPPSQIQVTLPASCGRSGTYLLNTDMGATVSSCPNAPVNVFPNPYCKAWSLSFVLGGGVSDEIVAIVGDVDGQPVIIVGLCGGSVCPEEVGGEAGTIWIKSPAGIVHWDDIDGLAIPHLINGCNPEAGNSYCTTADDAVISLPP